MNSGLKRKFLIPALLAVLALPVSGQTDIDRFRNAMDSSADILQKAMITNSALGLNWSDAWIGQLVGAPPHFGVGIAVGFTGISTDNLAPLVEQFGGSKADLEKTGLFFFPLPAASAELRIGGFFLPFDIGIKALPLPELPLGNGTKFRYTMAGGDVRYAVLREKKGWLPTISVGAGFTYTNAKVSTSLSGGQNVELDALNNLLGAGSQYTGQTLIINNPEVAFQLENYTVDFKVQISKNLPVIPPVPWLFRFTPYLGLGVSYGWSSLDYDVTMNSNLNQLMAGGLANLIQDINKYTGLDVSDRGMSKSYAYNGFGFRGFGGFSLNFFTVVRLDITALYDIVNRNWGGTAGIRVQI